MEKVDFTPVTERVSELVDAPVSLDYHVESGLIDWEAVRTLKAVGILSHQYGYRHVAVVHAGGDKYAQFEFAVFSEDEVAYFHWITVDESIRQHGVGRLLRRQALDAVAPRVGVIYSKATSTAGAALAESQGFQRIRHGDLDGWYVYE